MYKYTPSKRILHQLRAIRTAPYVLDKEYYFIKSVLPVGTDYATLTAFWLHFDGFEFYSPTHLQEVPLHGYLLPVSLFDEEMI